MGVTRGDIVVGIMIDVVRYVPDGTVSYNTMSDRRDADVRHMVGGWYMSYILVDGRLTSARDGGAVASRKWSVRR